MSWLRVIIVSLQALTGLVAFLRERKLIAAGEAEAIAEGLKVSNERVATAIAARRRALDSGPDPHDPNLRD